MKAGAHDYVMKGNLKRLIPAIQREMAEAETRRQRKRAEEAYRESEEQYRGLFEGSKDAIYFSTVDGIIIDINPAGIELFGYDSKEEFLSADVRVNSYVDPQQYQRRKEHLANDGFIKDFEFTLKRKDGTTAVVVEITVPSTGCPGTVTMYRTILRDVSKQKQLEQQFVQAQKMESIGTLAGGMAHDFNNILGIILGYGNLLIEKRTNPQEFSEAVGTIVQAVERGATLVQQILTFARKTEIQFKQTNLAAAVSDMLAMLKETFPKMIVIHEQLPKDIPDIYADPAQIYQALLNLCLNARDAMPNGGLLSLSTEVLTKSQVREHFPDADQESYACLSIMDTGEGMDEETRLKVFDPFFTTKKNGKGTGLGLSVVYGVMQAHLGFVRVESTTGQGTTFRLYFPVPASTARPAGTERPKEFHPLKGTETILYVEDEEFIRDIVRLTLESNGYKVYTARDGILALQLYTIHYREIDLVLSDLGLPGMSGIDELKKMKEINPDVNVVFTSGFFDQDVRNNLLQEGVKGFLQKPFQPRDILELMREVLDNKSA